MTCIGSWAGRKKPGRKERVQLTLPPEIKLDPIAADKTLNGMLESGEIDALISARSPSSFVKGSPKVKRLFPNYKDVEVDYYKRTKIFPIMHVLIIRKDIYDSTRGLRAACIKHFADAKGRGHQEHAYLQYDGLHAALAAVGKRTTSRDFRPRLVALWPRSEPPRAGALDSLHGRAGLACKATESRRSLRPERGGRV